MRGVWNSPEKNRVTLLGATCAFFAKSTGCQPLATMSSCIRSTSYREGDIDNPNVVVVGNDVNHKFLQGVAFPTSRHDDEPAMASAVRRIFHPEIGARLAKLRADKGLTQGQVAQLSKGVVNKNTLKSIEGGRIENPSPPLLRELARIYNVPFRDIALPFIQANYGSDLIRHDRDQKSGSSPGDSTNDSAATRMELERLQEIVARYDKEAREMRTATDAIVKVALALEKTRKTSQRESDSRRRDRKVG